MRILVLTDRFVPDKGGSITWLFNTYSRLDPVEVTFIVGKTESDLSDGPTLSFPVHRIPMRMSDWDPTVPASLWCYFQIIRTVRRICRENRINQVHCAKVLPEGLVAWVVCQMTGIPYIIYAHGEEITSAALSRKLAWIIPRVYNGAAAIIANSKNTQGILESIRVDSGKIHIIHPGVHEPDLSNSGQLAERVRAEYRIGDAPLLLTVGRLQRRKGQDRVIQALPLMTEQFPDIKYIIVGDGEERGYLEELARESGVSDRVIFAGGVSDEDLPAYYCACDLFIMPNREIEGDIEGFGIVFLEAGILKKPVIGGKSGGTADAIMEGQTGFRVDGNNIREIGGAVTALLGDPKRAEAMGQFASSFVRERFSWDSVVQKTQEIVTAVSSKVNLDNHR